MSTFLRTLAVAAAALLTARRAHAQLPAGTTPPTPDVLAARIDSVVRTDVLPRGFPSVSIAITRGGRPLLERAWGVADVATGRKAAPATTYNIGSLAKQFTAALVLKLADRGTLSIADSIGRHLKDLPPAWNGITIEQLLNHTSGLPRELAHGKPESEEVSGEAVIAMAARDTLVAKPGTAWAYSNAGYLLLGVLVETLHGKPYAAVLRDEIARPLGLTSLGWCQAMPKDRAATGYVRSSDGTARPRGAVHASHGLGSGSICSTAGDLAKWNAALHGGRVLSAASYAAMTTTRGAATGKYGFGLLPTTAMWGSPAIVHDAQDAGFTAHNGWFPAESLSVTLLYNALPLIGVPMADFVGMLALGGTPRPIPPVPVIQLPRAATQGEGRPTFVGAYELGVGRTFLVTFEEGSLRLTPPGGAPRQLVLTSGTSYTVAGLEPPTLITFNLEAGVVTGFTARANGVDRELRKVK